MAQFDWKHKCQCGHTAQAHADGTGTCHAVVGEDEKPCTCKSFASRSK